MNTLEELINKYNLSPKNAKQVINGIIPKLDKTHGEFIIKDIEYTGKGSKKVKLECITCKLITHMIVKHNKFEKMRKTCPACREQKRKNSLKEKKAVVLLNDSSYLGQIYGDFRVVDFDYDNGKLRWVCECVNCHGVQNKNPRNLKSSKPRCICRLEENRISRLQEKIGKRYNFLTIVDIDKSKFDNPHNYMLCKCDCGNTISYQAYQVESGIVKSCGCKKLELSSEVNTIHGFSKDKTYRLWNGMKARCYNEKNPNYDNYGGRGIKVCDEWLNDYMAFREWMLSQGYDCSLGYKDQSIDRIDVNGDYSPENCRLADAKTQANNKRPKNEWKQREYEQFEIDGVSHSFLDWCRLYKIGSETVRYRMKKKGMSLYQALTSPKETLGRPRKVVANA